MIGAGKEKADKAKPCRLQGRSRRFYNAAGKTLGRALLDDVFAKPLLGNFGGRAILLHGIHGPVDFGQQLSIFLAQAHTVLFGAKVLASTAYSSGFLAT